MDSAGGDEAGSADGGLDAKLDRAVTSGEPEAFLVGLGGDHSGRVYPLVHNTVYLGRAEDADVLISDASVSARHARIINGSQGFEIEDLGSTNGTIVEGRQVMRTRLRSGDSIAIGYVQFKFLIDRRMDATMTIIPSGRMVGRRPGILIRYEPPRARPGVGPPPDASPAGQDEDEGPSLEDVIGRLAQAYKFLQSNASRIVAFVAVGGLLGLISAIVFPAPRQAICVLKLQPQVKANPVDAQWNRAPSEDQEVRFFAGAETAFVQSELVAGTLTKMLGQKPTPAAVASVAERLKIESQPDNVYKATFNERILGASAMSSAEFLAAHIENYLHSDIARAIRVFTVQADFLRDQLKTVEAEMKKISDQKMQFREQNADRLPEEAGSMMGSRYTLEAHRAELVAQVRRLQGELDTQRRALADEAPLAQSRYKTSEAYRQSLATVNRKLTEAYAKGLADGHPEVRELKDEKERIEGLVHQEMASETSPLDRESNAGYQDLKSRVGLLRGQLAAARNDLADTEMRLSRVQQVVGDLPRVQAGDQQLTHIQDATIQLHGQLFEQLKKAELQLNLERVSAESRYEIVTPPHLVTTSPLRTAAIRVVGGAAIGLFLALALVFVREGRRIFTQALSNLDSSPTKSAR